MLQFRACLFVLIFSLPLSAVAQSDKFDVVKVAEGVYATIRKDSPGLAAEANNVFIINADDAVVVDTNISASSTWKANRRRRNNHRHTHPRTKGAALD